MHRTIVFTFTALFCLFGSIVIAGTIYTWTDADGVKRYSNSQPPEDVDNVQTIQEIQYDQRGDDKQRQEFDRMVEDAGKSADRHFEEQAQKKVQAAAAEQQQQLEAQTRQVEEELAKLREAIDDIQGRALGPTLTAGMKENQIRQIQKKINQLERNPDEYINK